MTNEVWELVFCGFNVSYRVLFSQLELTKIKAEFASYRYKPITLLYGKITFYLIYYFAEN